MCGCDVVIHAKNGPSVSASHACRQRDHGLGLQQHVDGADEVELMEPDEERGAREHGFVRLDEHVEALFEAVALG